MSTIAGFEVWSDVNDERRGRSDTESNRLASSEIWGKDDANESTAEDSGSFALPKAVVVVLVVGAGDDAAEDLSDDAVDEVAEEEEDAVDVEEGVMEDFAER